MSFQRTHIRNSTEVSGRLWSLWAKIIRVINVEKKIKNKKNSIKLKIELSLISFYVLTKFVCKIWVKFMKNFVVTFWNNCPGLTTKSLKKKSQNSKCESDLISCRTICIWNWTKINGRLWLSCMEEWRNMIIIWERGYRKFEKFGKFEMWTYFDIMCL